MTSENLNVILTEAQEALAMEEFTDELMLRTMKEAPLTQFTRLEITATAISQWIVSVYTGSEGKSGIKSV